MADNAKTVVLRGKVSYAKVLGDPVLNYAKDGKEWKVDFYDFPIKEVKALGIGDRVKQKDDYLDGKPFMSFKQSELKRDGKPNFPIKVEDISGKPWPQDKLLGNGTGVDLKFVKMDFGPGKKAGVYIRALRILDHVPYERSEFSPIASDDEFAGNLAEVQAMMEAQREAEDKAFKETFLGETEEAPDEVEDLDDDMPV